MAEHPQRRQLFFAAINRRQVQQLVMKPCHRAPKFLRFNHILRQETAQAILIIHIDRLHHQHRIIVIQGIKRGYSLTKL